MDRSELVKVAAKRANVSQPVMRICLEKLIETIVDYVCAGEKITLHGFGVFRRVQGVQRVGYNPHTGESIPIPPKKTPRFYPAKEFKKAVIEADKPRIRGKNNN